MENGRLPVQIMVRLSSRCAKCAKAHPGTVDIGHKKCEDCGITVLGFGRLAFSTEPPNFAADPVQNG